MRNAISILCLVALAGCSLMPDYQRPDAPVPASLPGPAGDGAVAAELGWQEFLVDEHLRAVVEQALANNRDLRIAALNVEKVAALVRLQRSELSPGFGAQAAGERRRIPEKMTDSGVARTTAQYAVEVGFLSWEIDLFGRIRSLSASALEQYLATEEAARAVQVALVSGTAVSYLRLAADAEGYRLAQATLAAQSDALELVRASWDAGVASDLDLRQAESQVEAARVSVAELAGAMAVDRHALELLLGGPLPPEHAPEGLAALAPTTELAGGLSSEVLLARPDIRAAEHRLRAANADIGAARAAFFPRITLTGALGTLSSELSGLFESGTRTWRVAPLVQLPLYAGGGLRARLEATKIEREIAAASYEKAIQTAFAEVADALELRGTLQEQLAAHDRLVVALRETLRLAEERYRAGVDGYLGVLVAQRGLFAAEQAGVYLRFAERSNRIALYRALGGGG